MLPPPAHIVVVREDYGGDVEKFAHRVSQYLKRKVIVRIEGECASACTMVTALPSGRICVGPGAVMEFHQAYWPHKPDIYDASDRSEAGTAQLLRHYPKRILAWIASKGGLTAELIVLRGAELRAMFRACW